MEEMEGASETEGVLEALFQEAVPQLISETLPSILFLQTEGQNNVLCPEVY